MSGRELTLEQAAGQVLVAGFAGPTAPDELFEAAGRGELGGVILFKRNLGDMPAVARLIAAIAAAAPEATPPLIAVDQEGGRVARLGPPVLRVPPMRALGGSGDPTLTHRVARVLGGQLAALGFNCDFAPVLDVDTNPDNPVIGDRSFGRDAETVITHALAFAQGLSEAGLLACGKHFPGHGDTELDSHVALPRLAHDRARLDAVELAPFLEARAHVPMIMTAHVIFDAIDPDLPATLSTKVVTGLLREEMGYAGVVVSDDLEMRAVADRWGVPDAAVMSIEAGCDAALVCSEWSLLLDARRALAGRARRDEAFAERLREAAASFMALRAGAPPKPVTDPDALRARLENDDAREIERELRELEAGER
jgi:beta-N-acetylhexosaminidase